jgi:hypothetical protein
MRVTSGTVVGNTVVLDEPLPEGAHVRVYADDEGVEHVDEETAKGIREAIAQADRGEVRPMSETLAKLRAKRTRRR